MTGLALAAGVVLASAPAPGLDALHHDDPELLGALVRLDRCVRDAMGEPRQPYRRGGNFYEARWCSGAGARASCQIAAGSADRRDQYAVRLFTLSHGDGQGDGFPKVFGLGAHLLRTPRATGWGADVVLTVGGRGVVGDQLSIRVARYDAPRGPPAATMELGARFAYVVERTELSVRVPGTPREILAAYTRSAEELRALVARELDALERQVLGALDRGEVETCTPGPYLGGGVPPVCPPRSLDESETANARARARDHFAAQRAVLAHDYDAIFTAVRGALPAGCGWP